MKPTSEVREGISDGRVILDMAFHHIHSVSSSFNFMVSTYAYSTFELSNAVLLLAKLLLESESWSHVWKSPTVRKSSRLSYPSWQPHQNQA